MTTLNTYAGLALDRAAHLRADERWYKARLDDHASRFVPVWRGMNLIGETSDPSAVLLSRDWLDRLSRRPPPPVLLGVASDVAHFAVDVSHLDDPPASAFAERSRFQELRRVGSLMSRGDAALLAYARAMLHWHGRHLFCGVCGSPTAPRESGHLRVCTGAGCGERQFPRTDPAVIMLVGRGDFCLLGRQKNWAPGLYSTLAGFVEPGESLEETVAREVYEESGVSVRHVRYHSSQPWPFPSSLMLGFFADAISDEIRIDPDELDDARWFSRAELDQAENWIRGEDLTRAGDGRFRLPNVDSIARSLVDDWRKERFSD